MTFIKHNSVTARLEKMRKHWLAAVKASPGIIIWEVKANESEMVDAFYLFEEGEEGQLPELFFQLDTVFLSSDTYSVALMNQLLDMYNESMKYYTPEGMRGLEQYKPLHQDWTEKQKTHPSYILDNLKAFANCVNIFDGLKLVVYCSSPQVYNASRFERWWIEAAAYGIPDNIYIMLRDSQEQPSLNRLCSKYPKQVQTIKTDLKMDQAIRQEAKSAGDPSDPAVIYRVAILDMAEAAGTRDSDSIYFHTNHALDAAKSIGSLELQSAALLSSGIHLFNLGKRSRALEQYNKALDLLQDTITQQPEAAQVASQVEAAKGALFFGNKNWKEALAAYLLMAQYAKTSNASILEMEGWRMAGYCARKMGMYQDAYRYTHNAYDIGISQEPEAIAYTTLPHTGVQLLELCAIVAPDETGDFENQLKNLLGHDWQTQFRTSKISS